MKSEIISSITEARVIAVGCGVRVRSYLFKMYGHGRWRKIERSSDGPFTQR
jgi:hypothetical protein